MKFMKYKYTIILIIDGKSRNITFILEGKLKLDDLNADWSENFKVGIYRDVATMKSALTKGLPKKYKSRITEYSGSPNYLNLFLGNDRLTKEETIIFKSIKVEFIKE